jgi:type II secretory pathway pseudopilin PulG
LIELLVVITLIGVALSIALPQLSEGLKNRRLSEAAKEVKFRFQFARERALIRNRAHGVCIFLDADTRGRISIIESQTTSCWDLPQQCNWQTSINFGEIGMPNTRKPAQWWLNLDQRRWSEAGIRLQETDPEGIRYICLRPNGSMIDMNTRIPVPPRGILRLRIRRFENIIPISGERIVRIPFGGVARIEL